MAKEIEKYFVRRLQTVLQEYLKDFSQNNVAKFSLGISNNISLENLSIKKDVLWKFHIPMYILDGKIGRINIKMPFNYKSNTSYMVIETVDLTVIPISESSIVGLQKDSKAKSEMNQEVSGSESYKKSKLRLWEDKMIKFFEALSPPTWIQKIVDNIYDNMCITIKKFTLNFQSQSVLGYETIMRVKFDELIIAATDGEWVTHFTADPKIMYKVMSLTKFRISLNASMGHSKSKDNEYHIVHPIDMTMNLTIQKQQQEPKEALMKMDVKFSNPLIIMLNKDQKNYLIKFNQLMANLDIIQDNYHFRPEVPVKKNGPEWWKYSIQAIIEKQKKFKLDLNFASSRIVLMKRYIALYKRKQNIIHVPWLTQFTSQDEQKFRNCERVLPLKDLLKYREWAFTEIHLEAKRYFNSSKDGSDGKSVKPLLEIWTNTINNENAFADKQKSEQDDVPVELQEFEKINLYEVLERDQAQVLNSYLQGVNNSPDQTELHIELTMNSVFLLLLDEKQEQQILYSPKNLRIYQNCDCASCNKNQTRTRRSQSLTEHRQQKQRQRPKLQTKIRDSQNELRLDDSFQTAKGNDENRDSFISDMDDLNDNGNQFVVQSENEQLNSSFQKKQGADKHNQSRAQRLFLIIEAKHIRASILKFRDNRVVTRSMKDPNEGGFLIADLRIMSPGYLSKYLLEDTVRQQKAADKTQEMKKKWIDFLVEIFDIVITKDPIFYNSDTSFKYLMEFLKLNEMRHFADFLEKYETDKNYFQDFVENDFKPYDQFFDENSESYLHLSKESQEKYQQYLKYKTGFHYSNLLEELHQKVVEQIKRYVFPVFLEEYGEWIMPICIEHLKQKGEYQIAKAWKQNLKDFANIKVDFCLQGKAPEFKIVPSQKNMKKQQTIRPKLEQTPSEADLQIKGQSVMNIRLGQQKVYLTSRSLKALVEYFGGDASQAPSEEYLSVLENKQLLECIMKSQALGDNEFQQQESPMQLSLELPSFLKIVVRCDALYNLHRSELKLQVSNLQVKSLVNEDFKHFDSVHPQLRVYSTLLYRHRHYQIQQVQLKELSVHHKFSKREIEKSHPTLMHPQTILSLSLNALLISSLVPNHAALTDTKTFIQVPRFKLELSSEITGLLEVVQLLTTKPSTEQKDVKKKPYRLFSPYGYYPKEDPILLAEMTALYQDHKTNNKSCRHCVIKYRKSISTTNLVVGDMRGVLEGNNDMTWFHFLQYLQSEPAAQGLEISFKCNSRIAAHCENYTKLVLNLLVVTADKGFFKNNVTVHCTSAFMVPGGIKQSKPNEDSPARQQSKNIFLPAQENPIKRHTNISKLQSETNYINFVPLTPRKPDVMNNLDARHVFYCKYLEAEIFQRHIGERQASHEEQFGTDSIAPPQDPAQLYMLAYAHQPLRNDILAQVEKNVKEKSQKTQLYCRLREVSIRYGQPLSACVLPTILQNLSFAMKYIANAWNIIYEDGVVLNPKQQGATLDFNAQSNPLKKLDDVMVLFSINLIQFFTLVQKEQNHSILLQIKDLMIEYNLDLINQVRPESKSQASQGKSLIINMGDAGRSLGVGVESQPLPILHCQEIQLNFSGSGHISVQSIDLQRIGNRISFQVLKATVRNQAQILLVVPHNSKSNPKALTVMVDFVTGLTDTTVEIDSVQICVSKETIQEYLLSINVIFLVLLQEFREFKTFVKRVVYYTVYQKAGHQHLIELSKFNKVLDSDQSPNQPQNFQLRLHLGYLNILFNKKQRAFCRLYVAGLSVEPKGKDMEVRIDEVGFFPQQNGREINLISPQDGEGRVRIRILQRRGEILVEVDNLEFQMVSKYINELNGFVSDIKKELASSKESMLDRIKKPRRKQVIEELERAIRNQSIVNVRLRNSSVTLPENSTSSNFVRVYFASADITQSNQKVQINVPVITSLSQNDRVENVVVDYREEMAIHPAHVSLMLAQVNGIEVTYSLRKSKGQVLLADRIKARVNAPLQQPLMFGNWEFKTTLHLEIYDLDMKMDMGKLQIIADLAKSNTTESSDLFDFEVPTLDKISIQLAIKSMKLRQQKFIHQEEDSAQYRSDDSDDGSIDEF